MKNTFLAFLVLCLSCSQKEKSMDWISIEGNKFVNESGETMVFHGVNIRDPHNLEDEGHWTKSHFEEAKAWGANVIRLPIHRPSWRTRGEEAYLVLLDQAVEWARELGLYLILDWHSIGNLKMEMFQHPMYITSIQESTNFWSTVSLRYARESALSTSVIPTPKSGMFPGKQNGKRTGGTPQAGKVPFSRV